MDGIISVQCSYVREFNDFSVYYAELPKCLYSRPKVACSILVLKPKVVRVYEFCSDIECFAINCARCFKLSHLPAERCFFEKNANTRWNRFVQLLLDGPRMDGLA